MSLIDRRSVAVVGGGVLGLSLSLRLAKLGFRVDLYEAAAELGGLAGPHDYGDFIWDRFYHCILPQDRHVLDLVAELGLASELCWTQTRTGYFTDQRFFSMSGNRDFLLFPLLSMLDKARLAALVLYATRFADPYALYQITAEEWLIRFCGRQAYQIFWRPLLKAKFGPFYDQIAAVFIWATLTRLFGARHGVAQKESLGYVRGGYRRILERWAEVLTEHGVRILQQTQVKEIRKRPKTMGCQLAYQDGSGSSCISFYDQVFFTGPMPMARRIVAHDLLDSSEDRAEQVPSTYLGIVCLVLTLKHPLTPYYVLNIGDETVELTGLIEMTNLIDRQQETAGQTLIYLPRYLASDDPLLEASDDALIHPMIERGLRRLFPAFSAKQAGYLAIHRARFIQALPLVRTVTARPGDLPPLVRPFQILNASMLHCATLNNNEVIGLVNRYCAQHLSAVA